MPAAELGRQARAVTKFPQRTTAECYTAFPGEVKSSCPISFSVSIPEEVVGVFDTDPSTGHRHMPPVGERRNDGEEDALELIERNRRWLAARREVSTPH